MAAGIRVRVSEDRHLRGALDLGRASGARALSLKDSLVVPKRLGHVAEVVAGDLPGSASTKLNGTLDETFARRLAAAGCATIEVGL